MARGNEPSDDDFADRRFEDTREKILFHLEKALEACVQPREFHALIKPLVDLQEQTQAIAPGVSAYGFGAVWRAFLKRADALSWAMFILTMAFGFGYLIRVLRGDIVRKSGSLDFIGTAYAAANVDPTATFIFHVVIAAMVPIIGIGGFCALTLANTPEARKAGKELLIGVTGFVLGAATRLVA